MNIILKKIKRNYNLYSRLRYIYGLTIGFHWIKRLYLKYIGTYNGKENIKLLDDSDANAVICERIKSGEPFMMARYGSVEFINLIMDRDFDTLHLNAGFFPNDEKLLEKFRNEYMKASMITDFLCIWNYKNRFLGKLKLIRSLPNIKCLFQHRVTGHTNPWVRCLEGKKVLVIHPFKETIESQYENRVQLKTLPKLRSLQVIKAVQTIAGNKDERFKDWFEALDYMKKEIDKADFDIAIIGCGAYGLPLAAHIKSIGKQGMHLGGGLQLFFGIKGGRWEDYGIYNKYWIHPMSVDVPKNNKKIEEGCYW